MAIKATEYVWHNGHLVPWDDAKIHVMAHVVNYGSSSFEGIRCYRPPRAPAIFRLRDHMLRLVQSSKIYRIELDYSLDEFPAAVEVVASNKVSPCYIRPYRAARIRASWRQPVQLAHRGLHRQLRVGQISRVAPTANTASMSRFVLDAALLRTPCRPWRRPARIT